MTSKDYGIDLSTVGILISLTPRGERCPSGLLIIITSQIRNEKQNTTTQYRKQLA